VLSAAKQLPLLTENFVCDPAGAKGVEAAGLYEAYKVWARVNGYQHPVASNKFAEEVVRVFPKVRKERKRSGSRAEDGKRRYYVDLKPAP
jgi:phage/plasmid-associated DNA primase